MIEFIYHMINWGESQMEIPGREDPPGVNLAKKFLRDNDA